MAASHNIPTNPENHSIVPRAADLRTLPIERAKKDPHKQVIIPDLHGCVLRLIEELYFQNVLEITRDDYAQLVDIYYHSKRLTTAQKQLFDFIINNRIQVDPHAVRKVIFLGDETADRGKNDYLMLQAFNLLAKGNVNYEILLSNHGAEFLKFIAYLEKHPLPSHGSRIQYIKCAPATSLVGLIRSLDDGVIQRSEVLNLFKYGYLPAATLLTCSVGGEKENSPVTVYTHARVGFETVSSLATHFKIPDKIKTTYDKCRTIEAINQAYRINFYIIIHVYDKQLWSCPKSVMENDESISSIRYPLVRIAWNRHSLNDTSIEKKEDKFFHGHVGPDALSMYFPNIFPQHTNLDTSNLGKAYEGNAVVATSDNYEGLIYTLIRELNEYVTLVKESKDVVEVSLATFADRTRRYLLRENFSVNFPENVEFTTFSATEENRLVQHPLFIRIYDILEQTKIRIPEAICPIHLLALPLRIKKLEAQKANLEIRKANIQNEFISFQIETKALKPRMRQSISDRIEYDKLAILRIKQELHDQKFTTRVKRFLSRNKQVTIAPTPSSLTTPAAIYSQPHSLGFGHSGINVGLWVTPHNEQQVARNSSIMLTPTRPPGFSSEQEVVDSKGEHKIHPIALRLKKQ